MTAKGAYLMASVVRPSNSAPAMFPVSLRERIDVVDILRGWAILGMLVTNLSRDLEWHYLFAKLWPGTVDRGAYFLLLFFAKGKFYTLFSFLFGWGFALQMGRAEARGVRFFPLYARRLLVLLLFGLMYKTLGPYGILISYALLGYFLFLFRACSLKTVLVAALLCFCYWPAHEAVVERIHEHQLADPRTAQATRQADAQAEAQETVLNKEDLRLHSQGSFKEIVVQHARTLRRLSSGWYYLGMLGDTFPLMLLGLYVGRRRILHDIPAHLHFIRRVFWWGLSLGLPATAVWVIVSEYPGSGPEHPSWVEAVAYRIGSPALTFFYASAIVLLVQSHDWKLRLAPLAPVGRMALSNYLFQGLIFVALFYSYGLGFYGRMRPLVGVALAVLIFPLQVLLSAWWMKRFRFGPAEWLWRTLTYGKLQPMRLAAAG